MVPGDERSPLSRREALELREAISSLAAQITTEFRTFRIESAQTFTRQDTHNLDLQLKAEAHNKDVALLTQTLTALERSMDQRLKGVESGVEKLNGDADWLKKLVYSTLIGGILTLLGTTAAAAAGAFPWH